MADERGIQGNTQDIPFKGSGPSIDGNIFEPISSGASGRPLSAPIYDFTMEWIAKVQPTQQGLKDAYVGGTYAVAKANYKLRVSFKNGVQGASVVSGRPVSRYDAGKKIIVATNDPSNMDGWIVVPVVGGSWKVNGDKPSMTIGRNSDTSQALLKVTFSLSKGRLSKDTVPTEDQSTDGAGTLLFPILPNSKRAKVIGINTNFADFYYKDPVGNDFMTGLGTVIGVNEWVELHPLAATLVVSASAAYTCYVVFETEE